MRATITTLLLALLLALPGSGPTQAEQTTNPSFRKPATVIFGPANDRAFMQGGTTLQLVAVDGRPMRHQAVTEITARRHTIRIRYLSSWAFIGGDAALAEITIDAEQGHVYELVGDHTGNFFSWVLKLRAIDRTTGDVVAETRTDNWP